MSAPVLDGKTFITDGGMETTLIFHHGLDLPHFASFVLLDDPRPGARMPTGASGWATRLRRSRT